MTDDQATEFTQIWHMAAESQRRTPPSVAATTMAFEILKPYELADIKAGIMAHLRDPDVGQYPIQCAHVTKHIEGSSKTNAAMAWNKVVVTIRRAGPYPDVIFDEAAIHAAIDDMGGWIKLCEVTDKELPFKGNEFKVLYEGYLKQRDFKYRARLPGRANSANHDKPNAPDEVVRIGNAEKVAQIESQRAATKALTFDRGVGKLTDKLRLEKKK